MVWAGLSCFAHPASRTSLQRINVAAYWQQAPIMPPIAHLARSGGVGPRHAAV